MDRCHAIAAGGTYVLSAAAEDRVSRQGLSRADVRSVLGAATSCQLSEDVGAATRTWLVRGPTIDGAPVALTVAFDGDVVMVL